MCGSPFSPSSELWSATSRWIVLVGTWNWRARGDSSMRIAYVTYRSRKTPGVIAQFFFVFWIQWFILSGRLCVDASIRQGHGGAWWGKKFDIGPIAASRRIGVWGNYWGTHYFYCVLKAILIRSFWCWWHFFEQTESWCRCFKRKSSDWRVWEGAFNFVAACDRRLLN